MRCVTPCRVLWLLPAVVACACRIDAAERVPRIVVLPLSDRASVVIEAERPLDQVAETSAECAAPAECVVVEGGPIGNATRSIELLSPQAVPIVKSVSLRPYTRSDGQTYFRVRVTVREPSQHALRVAGNRLYVDFAPPRRPRPSGGAEPAIVDARPRPAAPAVGSASSAVKPPAGTASPTVKPAAGTATAPRKPAAEGRRVEALDYDSLKADILRRAQMRARQPDVKGLLALADEVRRKDEQLGRQRPELVTELLDEVNRLLDEARIRQLEIDREAFRQSEPPGKK